MKNLTPATLIGLLAVYLVELGIPAPAYLAGVLMLISVVIRTFDHRISVDFALLAAPLAGLVIYLVMKGAMADMIGIAFIVNLTISVVVAGFMEVCVVRTRILSICNRVFLIFLCVATFDTIWKFIHPKEFDASVLAERDFFEFGFYRYKGSFFYFDSNALAFLLLPFLFFSIQLAQLRQSRLARLCHWLPLLYIVLSLSRAAYLSTLLLVVLKKTPRRLLIPTGVVLIFALSSYVGYLSKDLSGSYKLREMITLFNFWERFGSDDILFGLGFGQGDKIAGFFLQNVIVKISIELGLGGLVLYLAFMGFLIKRTKQWEVVLSLLLFSFSSNFYFFPPFCVAIVYLSSYLDQYVNQLRNENAVVLASALAEREGTK
jgi:hypothetical protein